MNQTEIVERNMDLENVFIQYVFDHPEILDTLPEDFQLVILPEDDPELAKRNQALLESQNFGKPVVIVRMKSPKPAKMRVFRPKIQVLAAA